MLSIVVPWRDRQELARALPAMVAVVRATGGDLTVVNFGGKRPALRQQIAGWEGDLSVVEVADQRYFNKSLAQNLGAAASLHPHLFFCDCDVLLDCQALVDLVHRLRDTPGSFATLAGVRESESNARGARHVVCFGYELRIRTADGRQLHICDHEEDAANGARQAPGLLLVRRSDFLSIGGYNSRLHGWGWEDQDMIGRLTLGAGLSRIQEGIAVHLSHDDAARIAAYPPVKDRWESRDRMFRQALANYDAADFQGTYEADVRQVPARRQAGAELLA